MGGIHSGGASGSSQKHTASFMSEIVDILIDYVRKQNDRNTKVCRVDHHLFTSSTVPHSDISDQPMDKRVDPY